MMTCAMCGQKIPNLDTSVCDQCRADAAMGRAVRNMPQDTDLYRALWKWVVAREAEALRAAGLMEGDE